jgi:hypothetical protein
VRRAHLGAPIGDLAGFVLHVDVEPNVRIRPLDLRDGSGERDRLVPVEFRRKGVVRSRLASGQRKTDHHQTTK